MATATQYPATLADYLLDDMPAPPADLRNQARELAAEGLFGRAAAAGFLARFYRPADDAEYRALIRSGNSMRLETRVHQWARTLSYEELRDLEHASLDRAHRLVATAARSGTFWWREQRDHLQSVLWVLLRRLRGVDLEDALEAADEAAATRKPLPPEERQFSNWWREPTLPQWWLR